MLSSGMRLSFVFAMKSHLGLLGIIRSVAVQSRIKGIATSEQEAFRHIRQSSPGLLICSDQLEKGDGFSLCRRAIQVVSDLKVLMVITSDGLTSDGLEVSRALDSGAMAVVCEQDLILMLKGASDRDISDQLLISIHTVKDYGKSIRSKYQVKSRLQLISALLGRSQEPVASVSSAR